MWRSSPSVISTNKVSWSEWERASRKDRVKHDDVGLAALQRADAILKSERAGAAKRGEIKLLECRERRTC